MTKQQSLWEQLYRIADSVAAPGLIFPGSQLPLGCRAAAIVPAPGAAGREQAGGSLAAAASEGQARMQAGGDCTDAQPEGYITWLRFRGEALEEPVLALRITFAANVKEEVEIEAFLADSNKLIGQFDVRYAYSKQMFEIPLTTETARYIFREGLGLRMSKGTAPVWILWGEGADCAAFYPHLLLASDTDADTDIDTDIDTGIETVREKKRLALFTGQLKSQVCYHRSGWMEGCVLDGLYDLYRQTGEHAYLNAVKIHLEQFLADNSGPEEHTGPRVQNGKIVADVTERTLPYAVLAKVEPDHPAIDQLIAYWDGYKREDGAVYDRETDTITGEGVYTAGYPMAAVAAARGRDDLAELALRQLHSRKERLVAGGGIYLRSDAEGRCSYLNWARAWAWYLLGAARILVELKDWRGRAASRGYADAAEEFARAAAAAASMQQEDGLWAVFTDAPASGAEAGGSAGIAAALALGVRYGLLEEAYRSRADAAWAGLLRHLTPDGLLGGVSQTNQGGEELQRSGYRVLFQMGMGLTAQLGAALGNKL